MLSFFLQAAGAKHCCVSSLEPGTSSYRICSVTCEVCSSGFEQKAGSICTVVGSSTTNEPLYSCQGDAYVRCDPIMTGFDGKEFHFNDAGDYTLLEDGDGWKVCILRS